METLAYNIRIHRNPNLPAQVVMDFDFDCPHCNQTHSMRERYVGTRDFARVGYALSCGWVTVEFGK